MASTHDIPRVDQLLTVDEVASVLRCSRQTVHRWRAEGRLPGLQLLPRGVWKFRARDVQEFISRGEREGAA